MVLSLNYHQSIHGVVTELSPIKCSKKNAKVKYFAGKLTDGKKMMRIVSFQSATEVTIISITGCSDVGGTK